MIVLIVLQDLQLEYVYGYRGFDFRNNLYYINDGVDIVFYVVGVGIVQNLFIGNRFVYCLISNELYIYRIYCNFYCVIKKLFLMIEIRRKWCILRVLIQYVCYVYFVGLFDIECLVIRYFLFFKFYNVGIYKVYLEKFMVLLLMFQEIKVFIWSIQMILYVQRLISIVSLRISLFRVRLEIFYLFMCGMLLLRKLSLC